MAQTMDQKRLTLEGNPKLVGGERIARRPVRLSRASVSTSATGVLAFAQAPWRKRGRIRVVRPDRQPSRRVAARPRMASTSIRPSSPNGQRIAVNLMDPRTGDWDIWIDRRRTRRTVPIDVRSRIGTATRCGRLMERRSSSRRPRRGQRPVPKGGRRFERRDAHRQAATAFGRSSRATGRATASTSCMTSGRARGGRSVWALPLFGDRKPIEVVDEQVLPLFGAPLARRPVDGVWLVRDRPGEIYVRRFPGPGTETADLDRRRRSSTMDR